MSDIDQTKEIIKEIQSILKKYKLRFENHDLYDGDEEVNGNYFTLEGTHNGEVIYIDLDQLNNN